MILLVIGALILGASVPVSGLALNLIDGAAKSSNGKYANIQRS